MRVLLIDNRDSFVYNLYQFLGELGAEVVVMRSDRMGIGDVERVSPTHIVISPGPSTPEKAGISCDVVRRFCGKLPILGVCLGHQCIAHSRGGKVERAPEIKHGRISLIHHDGKGIFRGIPNPMRAIRYHSLIVTRIPRGFEISALSERGLIMGIRHKEFPVEGVQFHPESIFTEYGKDILRNFLEGGS